MIKKLNKFSETKLELMYAAEILFGQKGINNTSHRDIINITNQKNISAISYHFQDLEGLVRALLELRMSIVDADREERYKKIIKENIISNNNLMDAYIDPLYERCISDKEWANYIYFLKHLITDYDIQFINYLQTYSKVTLLIENELKKINNIHDDGLWNTKLLNVGAFLTASLASRKRELDNNNKVPDDKKYLNYLKKSVLNIFLFK